MLNDIHIFDDIISIEYQDILENYFLNDDLRWRFINNVKYIENVNFPQYVIPSEDLKSESIKSIILEIEKNVLFKLKLNILSNYRYKINLLKKEDFDSNRNELNSIHVDRDNAHISMVYYINDSDGNTSFYNLNDGDLLNWKRYLQSGEYDRFTQFKSVSPKKGRVIVFNGLIPHNSSYPKLNNRLVLNFNTVVETKTKSLF